ncbi:pheromone B beta 1 receptor-like [Homalodisca vitripennis]|uniref:pheromone B beta 1 receptor-like n=1 Tax=Homalodisca vitripennis TaxID=197043 RepID=UPI001EEB8FE8|nr:pheromone B beta 1 receptor-like [Homalodisca vitripennis]
MTQTPASRIPPSQPLPYTYATSHPTLLATNTSNTNLTSSTNLPFHPHLSHLPQLHPHSSSTPILISNSTSPHTPRTTKSLLKKPIQLLHPPPPPRHSDRHLSLLPSHSRSSTDPDLLSSPSQTTDHPRATPPHSPLPSNNSAASPTPD